MTEMPNNIVFSLEGKELLRIAPEGFYVRGIKVRNKNESQEVYKAFKRWLNQVTNNGLLNERL
jgi:hypothetical protein